MMKEIKIKIDCGELNCGICEYHTFRGINTLFLCRLFIRELKYDDNNESIRCSECLEAEVKE